MPASEISSARGKRSGVRVRTGGATRTALLGTAVTLAIACGSAWGATNLGSGSGTGQSHIAIGGSDSVCTTVGTAAANTIGGYSGSNSGAVANGASSIAIGNSCSTTTLASGKWAVAHRPRFSGYR